MTNCRVLTAVLIAGAATGATYAGSLAGSTRSSCYALEVEVGRRVAAVGEGVEVRWRIEIVGEGQAVAPRVYVLRDEQKPGRPRGYFAISRHSQGEYEFGGGGGVKFTNPGSHLLRVLARPLNAEPASELTPCDAEVSFQVTIESVPEVEVADAQLQAEWARDSTSSAQSTSSTHGASQSPLTPDSEWSWYCQRMDRLVTPSASDQARGGTRYAKLEELVRQGAPETRSSYFRGWFLRLLPLPTEPQDLARFRPGEPRGVAFGSVEMMGAKHRLAELLGDPYASCQFELFRLQQQLRRGELDESEISISNEQLGVSCSAYPVSRRLGELMLDLYAGKAELRWMGWKLPDAKPKPLAERP